MHIRILDLDGSILLQHEIVRRYRPEVIRAQDWGPRLRLACGFGRFRRFEQTLAERFGCPTDNDPVLTLYGSGDFHHVSLALLRRQTRPFNLLVLDNHPDWMRGVPLMHCGTWLYHAARMPLVQRIFHVGGDVDFDNFYRWLAPWPWLRSGKITVFPARRRFQGGSWSAVAHQPLVVEQIEELLRPYRDDLARWPLYISLDKDVMVGAEAQVNWDSGYLKLAEVQAVVQTFLRAAGGNLAGMDTPGDWSPVRTEGLLRRFLHVTEHPALALDPTRAACCNERVNIALLETIQQETMPGKNEWWFIFPALGAEK